MLFTCVKTEFMKCRRSFIWPVLAILPIIPAIMGTANYQMNLGILTASWYSLWTQVTLFYALFFYAPLIAVCCAYLWRVENYNHNRNSLFTAPVPYRDIFMGKFIMTSLFALFTQFWLLILFIICGKICSLPGLPPLEIFYWLFRGFLGGLSAAAAILLLAAVIRSFAFPIVLSFVLSIFGLILSNLGYGLLFPFSLMAAGMNSSQSEDMLAGQGGIFYAVCLLYLLLFLSAGTLLLKKTDVKA